MKQLLTISVISLFLSSFTVLFDIAEVINAVKSGNATMVAKFFDNSVEISMPDKSNSYSKSQAEQVLQDFFNLNPVKGFEIIHKGGNEGSQFCIGTLLTRNGSFRTTIFMKQKGDRQVVQELRFEAR
jgi:hypothetical protein